MSSIISYLLVIMTPSSVGLREAWSIIDYCPHRSIAMEIIAMYSQQILSTQAEIKVVE